jgi:hypothetical protein
MNTDYTLITKIKFIYIKCLFDKISDDTQNLRKLLNNVNNCAISSQQGVENHHKLGGRKEETSLKNIKKNSGKTEKP